ncbi:hypothetical protein [Burkholderia cenocepacia]|uniref:hypothetical protein n=1 Tax=Burkholderia cenocepacia TaxID=95486 RepID=UPI0028B43289|nr:hypothetical protein [Burkholderia cenocepacia]MDT6993200.1 hypothetical protein [Burkholderia cenocepacia]
MLDLLRRSRVVQAFVLPSESMRFAASDDGETTTICCQFEDLPSQVTLACETERLDVFVSILRRDCMAPPGAAKMPDDERVILLENFGRYRIGGTAFGATDGNLCEPVEER